VSCGGERRGVADDGEDLDGGPEPEAGHRGQDLGKRVGLQAGFEVGGEVGALEVDIAQLGGDAGDDPTERGRARDNDGLGVQRGEDLGWQGTTQPWRPRPHHLGHAGLAEFTQRGRGRRGGEQVQDTAAVDVLTQQAFQRRVDVQQGASRSRLVSRVDCAARSSS
jgi:hypothetical protein